MTRTLLRGAIAATLVAAVGTPALAQTADFRWEKQLATNAHVRVHNLNGDVSVVPSTNGRVEVLGYSRSGSRSRQARVEVAELSDGIRVCVMFENMDGRCDEDGYNIRGNHRHDDDDNRSAEMRLEVKVPAGMQVSASSVSGDVSVRGVQGMLRATSVSGDVRVSEVRVPAARVTSVSGDVDLQIVAFTGGTSEGVNARSVSGDVTLELPKELDADLVLRTVSGELHSDYQMQLNGRMSRRRLEARIGRGGRELDISTVSGDVRLRAAR